MMLFKKQQKKIDFLVGGTQKGGTSALDYYLRKHPQIGMGKNKELHFFDNENIFSKLKISYKKLDKCFDFNDNNKIYGESTPIYMYWEPSCRRIWEYNPDIKLIFILRDPVKRAFSHWNMEYDRQADSEGFGYAIRNENRRIRKALPYQHRVFSYIDRGFYSEQIRRFKRFFKDDQLMFIKYEDFKLEQEKTLIQIFKFLEVDLKGYEFEHKIVHKRKKHSTISEKDKSYLIDVYKYDILQVEKMLNWDCSDWLE